MKTSSAGAPLLILICLALLSCGPGITPKSGTWEAGIIFNVGTRPNIVRVSFTVNEAGNQIEKWLIYDTATRHNAPIQGPLRIQNNSFEFSQQDQAANTDITYSVKGTFASPTKVKGTYTILYSSLGKYEGEWEGDSLASAPGFVPFVGPTLSP